MPGPWKPYNSGTTGITAEHLYEFLQDLWDSSTNLRTNLLNAANEKQVRLILGDYGIIIPERIGGHNTDPPLRIMLMDIQSAQTWYDTNIGIINPDTDYFYILVMPPIPTRYDPATQPGYEEMQSWESAWYHAIVDGYGM